MSRLYATLLCTWLASACGPDAGTGPQDNPDGGMPGDACTGAECTPPPDGPEPVTWTFDSVNGVANIDDDDGAQNDWAQAPFAADDDFSTLTLPAAQLALVPSGGSVELSLAGDLANVRVFDGAMHVLGAERGVATHTFAPSGGDKAFTVEFGAYLARAELTLTAKDGGGATSATTKVVLQASPLIINHHLQPAEAVWAVSSNGNAAFIQGYQQALGAKFTAVPSGAVAGDVWMQDEFEFATMVGEDNQRIDVVIDSIRNRGLQNYSAQWNNNPDELSQTWGNPQLSTSYDSFGNLEATPPFSVGGVDYPFGKIYYGRVNTSGMNTTLGNFLASQKVQAPFTIPTNWLCVGHVDEFVTFVPAPGSAKGFKLVVSDTTSAWNLLATLPRTSQLPMYGQDHGYPTVASLLDDTALRALNDDVQADYLEPTITKFKTELGLTDADIIRLPSLFEQPSGCSGRVAALIPGMVNLIVANVDGTTTHLFTADPFFRAVQAQSSDPIISAFQALMPPGMTMHFLDNWDTYHLGLGEVHCGTNVRRTPTATWWTTATHLMGGN